MEKYNINKSNNCYLNHFSSPRTVHIVCVTITQSMTTVQKGKTFESEKDKVKSHCTNTLYAPCPPPGEASASHLKCICSRNTLPARGPASKPACLKTALSSRPN